jgi:hypothetical protein
MLAVQSTPPDRWIQYGGNYRGFRHSPLKTLTPDSVKKLVDQAEADIIACKIKVDTALQPRDCKPGMASTAATMDATMTATASK